MRDFRSLYKNTLGVIVILIAVSITLIFLFNRLTKKSFYADSGTIKVSGLKEKVNIYSDHYGVPHIVASENEDMYYALGYMHAKDRLWQMDLFRRVAEGRLSEILGKETIEYDKLYRTLGFKNLSLKLYNNLSNDSKRILDSYVKGVNQFIKDNIKNLPFEFDVLNYKPEEWRPENSLQVIRLMGWELNISWYTDYTFGEIVKKLGYEKAQDFFPGYPEDAPFIIKGSTDKKTTEKLNYEFYKNTADLSSVFFKVNSDFKNYFGLVGTHIGSNSWVVSGKKTENKKPLIANDMHLVLQCPSRWYEVGLENTKEKSNTVGFSIPGAPGIATGTNGIISWGITNLMNDDSDFNIFLRDSSNYGKYIYNGNSLQLDSTIEEISVKDVPDPIELVIYQTEKGVVISDLEKTGFLEARNFKNSQNKILTFNWTGYQISDEIKCFYELNKAKNFREFKNALKYFGLPASNFTYADTAGNIGYHAAGLIPIRKVNNPEINAMIPSDEGFDWSGFIPFDELPELYNPPQEYIITANNKPFQRYKYYISNLYESPYRAERIEQALINNNNLTVQEFKLLQNDVKSLQAKDFLSYLFEAYKDTLKMTSEEKTAISILKKWDYEMTRISFPAAIYSHFELSLYKNLYENILGEDLFKQYIFVNNVPIRNTSKLLKENISWILRIEKDTTATGNRDRILRKSLNDALLSLKNKFNTDLKSKPEWGFIHKVIIKHPLGTVPALSGILNIGPFEIGGCGTTVANTEYAFLPSIENGEFLCHIGASQRFIADMSDLKKYYSVLPSGQSGQPNHVNYSDQIRYWLNGEYKTVSLEVSGNQGIKLLILLPENDD